MNLRDLIPLFALVFSASAACSRNEGAPSESAGSEARASPQSSEQSGEHAGAASGLTLVADRSLVCMVNDQFMGRPQIPIEVEGKSYYGCCEMCKGRLAKDAAVRAATDPVTKKTVDKAVAVIAKTESGSTLYFENEASLAAYGRQSAARSGISGGR